MFDMISPGADSAITSLVTLLSIAYTLNEPSIKNDIKSKSKNKNVLFALFDGEAFDYIGSSRAVYDMTVGKFPVDPKDSAINRSQIRAEHFSHFIELNQLAFHDNQQKQILYMHKNLKSTPSLQQLEDIIERNANETDDLQIKTIADGSPLPPSSLQSFLKHNKEIVGVVIANHEKQYTNKFYNSLYDDYYNLNKTDENVSKRLSIIATVISKSIYEILTGNKRPNITVNETLIDKLLECYLINSACDLFTGNYYSNRINVI
jgi:nicastrin